MGRGDRDPRRPRRRCRHGRADLAPLRGPATRTWTIPADHVVLPGLTDAHLHLGDAARAATELDLTGLDRRGVAELVAAAHAKRAVGGRRGWLAHGPRLVDGCDRRPPLRGDPRRGRAGPADRALGARPPRSLAERRGACAARASARSRPRAGGLIERDADGAPTGLLLEGAAALVDAAIPCRTEDEEWSALAAYASTLHALGVTSVQDPGDMAPDPTLRAGPTRYRRLATEGRLPIRVAASIRREQLEVAIERGFRTGRPEVAAGGDRGGEAATVRYRDGWLKLFADGSLGTRSASLLAPYEAGDRLEPAGGPRGMALLSAR